MILVQEFIDKLGVNTLLELKLDVDPKRTPTVPQLSSSLLSVYS